MTWALLIRRSLISRKSPGLLAAAKTHFETVVQLNPDTAVEAEKAKKYIANIDLVLAKMNSTRVNIDLPP